MLLTVSTTRTPATDLGYLLVKHPDRVQSFSTTGGTAYVWFPEATHERCTAALLLDVDPVALARPAGRNRSPEGFSLGRYVNDRPYAASSLLAVALGKVFRTALKGSQRERPELAGQAWPLRIEVPALSCRGGPEIAERVFAPLGWQVRAAGVPLDPEFPDWGDSRYVRLELSGELRLADALNHLYVLLPVLDDTKHYWISPDEVDKLLRAGEGWLAEHPDKQLITRRYLRHRRSLTHTALDRLRAVEDEPVDTEPDSGLDGAGLDGPDGPASDGTACDGPTSSGPAPDDPTSNDPASNDPASDDVETAESTGLPAAAAEQTAAEQSDAEPNKPLNAYRKEAVLAALREAGAARVLDLGCGEGSLLLELARESRFTEVIGADVSSRALQIAERRLSRLPARQYARVRLLQSALTYQDDRLTGYDAAVLMEVIEHLDPERLPAMEATVFGHASPDTVIVTTPNAEYNVRYEGLTGMRHHDHRFEWTRREFAAWATRTGSEYGYRVDIRPVGDVDPELGPPTQLAYFQKETS